MTVLIGNSRDSLKDMIRVFEEVCKREKLKVNVGSEVVVCAKAERGEQLNLSLNGEILEDVHSVKYL